MFSVDSMGDGLVDDFLGPFLMREGGGGRVCLSTATFRVAIYVCVSAAVINLVGKLTNILRRVDGTISFAAMEGDLHDRSIQDERNK